MAALADDSLNPDIGHHAELTADDGGAGGGTVGPTWVNGLTQVRSQGTPPTGWTQGSDGAWYPPTVAPPPPPTVPRSPFIPLPLVTSPIPAPVGVIPTPAPIVVFPYQPPPVVLPEPVIDQSPPGPSFTTPVPSALTITVVLRVNTLPKPVDATLQIGLTVHPPIPVFQPEEPPVNSVITIHPIPLPIESAISTTLKKLLAGKVDAFFDESRKLHTLLNFGLDYQALITDWQYDFVTDPSGSVILVKLYQPLPDEIDPQTPVWVIRELAPPVIDRLYAKFTPPPAPKIFLRPPNRDVQITGTTGATVANQTLTSLLSTSSFNLVRPTDPTLEGWFTDDINSAELNVNYADYREFVFFGSAVGRLNAFANKLLTLEDYDRIILANSASLQGTGSSITGSAHYPALQAIGDKRIDLIRSFDAYERFLYYKTDVPYSSSVNTDDFQDELLFNADCTWPKLSGSVLPVASASGWFEIQSGIALEYDNQNPNSLVNNSPQYLQNDTNSQEFITFLWLVGQQFDMVKLYIDQMTRIYDRGSDSSVGLSPDLIWNVAQGFGIDLPNQYAVKNLVDYTIGVQDNQKIYREIAAETWKRFMHNQIFMMKAKGTKAGLRALANSYGILPTLLQIRESATPGVAYPTQSFEQYEEQTNVLTVPSGSWIELPWAASSSLSSSTVEIRFATTNPSSSVLFHDTNLWALKLIPTSGTFGTVALVSASITAVSSSVLPIFSGDFFSAMLRYSTSSIELQVKQATADVITVSSITSEGPTASVAPIWFKGSTLYLGGSGSFFGSPFAGSIDEFRMWGEVLTTDIFDLHVKYPGLYNGNTDTSARDNLYVRLSFNKPQDLGAANPTYIFNEAPSFRTQPIKTVNFPHTSAYPFNMGIIIREVVRYAPNAGGGQFTTNKIIIADPPVFRLQNGVPVLDPKNSIVTLAQKADQGKPGNVVGFYFSLTEAINDNIIRTFGNIDLQDLIGDPKDTYASNYPALTALSNLYWTDYAYTYNINTFVDFVRNLLDPLFRQAKQMIPARAKLLSGIVHEPNILERAKVVITNPPEVSGGSLTKRNTKDTQNLEAPELSTQPDTPDAGWEFQDALFTVSDNFQPMAENDTLDALLTQPDVFSPTADYDVLDSIVTLRDTLTPSADDGTFNAEFQPIDPSSIFGVEFITLDDQTNFAAFKLEQLLSFGVDGIEGLTPSQQAAYNQAVQSFRSPMSININDDYIVPSNKALASLSFQTLITPILPFTNFDDIEAFTYFDDPNGLIAIPVRQLTRVNDAILRDRGEWVAGTAYSRDDVVTITDPITANAAEFVCVTTDTLLFVSFITPSQDQSNWKPVQYVPTLVPNLRKAVLISGSVSIAATSSLQPIVVGYRPQHFKFTRDMRQGIIRHQWLGCLQTSATTSDGKDPVEIFHAPGSNLVVTNPGEPIQSPSQDSGPILDVQ
jgi:hypothetical protein